MLSAIQTAKQTAIQTAIQTNHRDERLHFNIAFLSPKNIINS
jgi:hypothetical protein